MPIQRNIVKWQLSTGYILPIILIMIGFYLLAKQYGIINEDVNLWPWVLIIIGVTWLAVKFKK
tara:strand:+ start:386 stop:574 length:189 start_codon:yes stop_codon:yes gene_type:complete